MDTQTDFGECRTLYYRRTERIRRKILGAEEKILSLEARLFNELVLCLSEYIPPIQMNANLIGRLDCLLSFAKVAEKQPLYPSGCE